MALSCLPQFIHDHYEIHEWNHASAILQGDFPNELADICDILTNFRLRKSHILTPGGRKSPIAEELDSAFYERLWCERKFDTRQQVDGVERLTPTHSIDCFKNNIGVEIEWNNKDPFFDRDLNNFRLLFELKALSVGVIITRCSHLQETFADFGKKNSYGSSTTHFGKLKPRIDGAGSGGCPVLAFGISDRLLVDDTALHGSARSTIDLKFDVFS
jgi:hypothetical protein